MRSAKRKALRAARKLGKAQAKARRERLEWSRVVRLSPFGYRLIPSRPAAVSA